VATLKVSLFGTRYETDYQGARAANQTPQFRELPYYQQALDRLRALPGVEMAGVVDYLPLTKQTLWSLTYTLDSGQDAMAMAVTASPGYFRSMGVNLLEGRDFTGADRQGSEPVAIVNEEFARRIASSGGVLGRRVTPDGEKPLTIVGVVGTTRYDPLRNTTADAQVYTPMAQDPASAATFTVRVRGNPESYLPVLRDSLRQVDPDLPVYGVATLVQRLQQSFARPRFYTTAVLFFAVFALLLAVIGAYGAASYAIAQRTQEIGVRMAVGASPWGIRGMLLRQSMLPVLIGVLAGIAGADVLGRFLESLIATAEPTGAGTCAAAAALLAAAAATAVWTATSRIVRMDPTAALRAE
jgi:predicted permease